MYVFDPGNCIADGGADVFNEDCVQICFLGGLMGNIICLEEDFAKNATDRKIIWQN